jgi:hypothetical protein
MALYEFSNSSSTTSSRFLLFTTQLNGKQTEQIKPRASSRIIKKNKVSDKGNKSVVQGILQGLPTRLHFKISIQ